MIPGPLRFALALAISVPASARPTQPDLPLGTSSASFAGFGSAHAPGVASLFANPAALSVRDAFQAEAGLMGLSSGLSPYFLFGAPAGPRGSYALGYWYDDRPGDPESPAAPRQGLALGASWEALPWVSAGAALKAAGTGEGVGADGFGIDADLGSRIGARHPAWLGLVLRNAMESGIGQVPGGFRTHRSYAIAAGTGLARLRLAGIPFHEPDAYYELRAHGLPPDGRVAHAFSLASAFFPEGRLGFRGTLALPQGGEPGYAWGTFLNLPLRNSTVAVAYVFHAGGSAETGEGEASHSLSLNYRMGGKPDPLPPWVEVTADRPSLFLGDSAAVHFRLSARDRTFAHGKPGSEGETEGGRRDRRGPSPDAGRSLAEGRIAAWTLSLRQVREKGLGLAGEPVRTYRGRELPPRIIRWEVDDEAGRKLPAGFYAFRLEAEDAAGNAAATAWQLIEIRPPPADGAEPKP